MKQRSIEFSKKSSFFLFGARGTGKTNLLKQRFSETKHIYIDLLNPQLFRKYLLNPNILLNELEAVDESVEWIIIDEVQKVPELLDLVHFLIESQRFKFALSGSSARKLRRSGANLLAGRAFVYHLFPFSNVELDKDFDINEALHWGTLPKINLLSEPSDKTEYLKAYANTYLREEIIEEQVIRKLLPFHKFLAVAAQMDGKIVNFAHIARESGTTIPTIQNYFQILEDTLLGFFLQPYHQSIRKRQLGKPKFYFIDNGIKRALANELSLQVNAGTSVFGFAFESWVINEIRRRIFYKRLDYELSYIITGSGVEIDLIITLPNKKGIAIEIKSTTNIDQVDLKNLVTLGSDLPNFELYCFSLDQTPKKFGPIMCYPWEMGLEKIGL